jgi:proteasome lid subunit RPN8/RPN11
VGEFRIPGPIARALVEHAQAEYPKECCGILAGPPGEPREQFRLTNVDPDPVMRYNADPKELKRVYDDIFDRDWQFVAIYHSHTHSPAVPSATDVERAFYPEAVYVLVSLQDRAHPDLRAFQIVDRTITELQVVEEEVAL